MLASSSAEESELPAPPPWQRLEIDSQSVNLHLGLQVLGVPDHGVRPPCVQGQRGLYLLNATWHVSGEAPLSQEK